MTLPWVALCCIALRCVPLRILTVPLRYINTHKHRDTPDYPVLSHYIVSCYSYLSPQATLRGRRLRPDSDSAPCLAKTSVSPVDMPGSDRMGFRSLNLTLQGIPYGAAHILDFPRKTPPLGDVQLTRLSTGEELDSLDNYGWCE